MRYHEAHNSYNKIMTTSNAFEAVEELDHYNFAGANVNGTATLENNLTVS
jgi:hypothetical protein